MVSTTAHVLFYFFPLCLLLVILPIRLHISQSVCLPQPPLTLALFIALYPLPLGRLKLDGNSDSLGCRKGSVQDCAESTSM